MRKEMLGKVSFLLIFVLIFGMVCNPLMVCAAESETQSENGITVTTSSDFITALSQQKSPITVDGRITIGDEADSTGKMLPVIIPADTVIIGTTGSSISSRSPIQLEGDNVTFKDIELVFSSTNALGSVPHREIFLAGHSLTMDNVSTYLSGADNSLGMIGGTEEELLPTVYAGGFEGTEVGENASLTVINANADTMFKGIYMGHEAESDAKIPYTGAAVLNLDTKVIVREGVHTVLNSSAAVTVTGEVETENSIIPAAKTTAFYGNADTTLTIGQCTMNDAVISNIGNLVLDNAATVAPQTDTFANVLLKNNACLDLNNVPEAAILGDFTGENGSILVLGKEGVLTINGTVSGTTTFQTGSRQFPGTIYAEHKYIIAKQSAENDFVLAQGHIDNGCALDYSEDGWWVYIDYTIPKIGNVEIVHAPDRVDIHAIRGAEGTIPDDTAYLKMYWYDEDGVSFSREDLEYYQFENYNCIVIKTDDWNSTDEEVLTKTDWNNDIVFEVASDMPDYYYLRAEINEIANVYTGNYTFLFCEDDITVLDLVTVADVQAVKDMVIAECPIEFYDASEDTGTEKTDIADEDIAVSTIADCPYTGAAITPEIEITRSSTSEKLILGEDYTVAYENNIDAGNGKAVIKITGIGNFKGEREVTFNIVKCDAQAVLTGNGESAVSLRYGDLLCLELALAPWKENADIQPEVKFYLQQHVAECAGAECDCETVLLGTVTAQDGKAVFDYSTAGKRIFVGTSTIFAAFSGNNELKADERIAEIQLTLEKKEILATDIASVQLEDFKYDGNTKTTQIVSVILSDGSVLAAEGTAELSDVAEGSYDTAKILTWNLTGENSAWYQLAEVPQSITVSPAVTILPADEKEEDGEGDKPGEGNEGEKPDEGGEEDKPGEGNEGEKPNEGSENENPPEVETHIHKYFSHITKTATCAEKGIITYQCTGCNHFYTEEIAKTEHTYQEIITKATTQSDGAVIKQCTACQQIAEQTAIAHPQSLTLEKTQYTYNKKSQKPAVTIKDTNGQVISADNYTVTYTNNKNAGIAKVTVIFQNNYEGTMETEFTILPKTTKLTKVRITSKGISFKWKKQKQQTNGYVIQYSTSSNFKKKNTKTVTVKNSKTTSKTIKIKKMKKKYFVRICTYKNVKKNGKTIKVYSAWSKKKVVKK